MTTTPGALNDSGEPGKILGSSMSAMNMSSGGENSASPAGSIMARGVSEPAGIASLASGSSDMRGTPNPNGTASPLTRGPGSSSGRPGNRRGPKLVGAFTITPQPVAPSVPFLEEKKSFTFKGQTYELDASVMDRVEFIGQGVHGTVEKYVHQPSGAIMAVKQIPLMFNSDSQHNTLREVDVSMRAANCKNVVHFYGALQKDGSIWMCMELMDTSLEHFYKKVYACNRTLPEDVLGVVASSVLNALHYLHTELKVIHRDVKPSNILVNRNGEVKICDFGISGRLVNSVAKSQVGAQLYMAPERVVPEQGRGFDVRSDVWSFGISMIEVATGKFPYAKWNTLFDQIKQVVNEEPPKVPPGLYSADFDDLVNKCLQKDVNKRPKYAELIRLPFVVRHTDSSFNIAPFVAEILDSPIE